ncbi:MAG: tripartite tricarboxylate transporter substrate binding protein [Xenophilus sp.]
MQRRDFVRAAGALAAVPWLAHAQSFPSRPVTLMVPYAAGGNADLTARLFADALTRTLGQAAVVDNRGGGGGAIGVNHVIASRPDGYTLLFSAPGVFSVTPHLVKVSYTLADMKPVCLITKTPLVLVVKKGSRYASLADLIRAAKATPGGIAMGYSGLGTPNHLALLNLEAAGKVNFNPIAYKGSGPMLQDMLAGQIEAGTDQYSTSRPYIESGDLIPLAVFGAPLPSLSGVPSVSTLGKEPFDVTTYLGIAAPKKPPDAVVSALQKATRAALADERFVAGIDKLGSTVQWGSGADYDRVMRAENDFVRQMVESGRMKSA